MMRKSPLVSTELGWPSHPAAVTYLERELAEQLWLAEMGIAVSDERSSPVLGLFVASWCAALVTSVRQSWRPPRWHRRTAIPRVFYR